MTKRAKFEAMLEALINEDQEAAKEIFHNIVVEKSREIYEELLESDFGGGIYEEAEEEEEGEEECMKNEAFGEEEEEGEEEEAFGDEEEEGEEEEESDDFGSDESDEESEGELEDRVLDLEDALDELKAEFEQLMAGEESEPEHADMFGGEEEPADEFGAELGGEEEMDEFAYFMEYVNKVALPKHGDDGANKKSVLNKSKYNDMGGTVSNLVQGAEADKKGTKGGLLNPSTQDLKSGNVNVPGNSKAPKLSTVSKGHGAEKKGTGEQSVNDKSLIKGR